MSAPKPALATLSGPHHDRTDVSDSIRLSHRVTELTGCSRSEAEQYIQNGWVSVDGEVIEMPQHMVSDESVKLSPWAQLGSVEPATILLHKPVGVDAIKGANPASALISPQTHWSKDDSGVRILQRHFRNLTALVPLEVEASGLLVFSQDKEVYRRLVTKGNQIEHEYLVEVSGEIAPDGLHRLKHGLHAKGHYFPPCQVSWQNETRLRVAIKGVREGQLRDVCAQVGLEVISMRRLRLGRIPLGKAMPPGEWRYMNARDRF